MLPRHRQGPSTSVHQEKGCISPITPHSSSLSPHIPCRRHLSRLLLLVLLIISSSNPGQSVGALAADSGSHGLESESQPMGKASEQNRSERTTAMPDERSQKMLVETSDTATLDALKQMGATLLVDYDTFSLWRVSDTQSTRLATQGTAQVRPDMDKIWLRDGFIDTQAGGTEIHPGAASSDDQFWMVQFIGPIKDEWLAELRSIGLELVIYMPSNAYVIWGDGDSLSRLEALAASSPVIQWTGPYQPDYRVDPALQQQIPGVAADQMVDVTVQFYTTAAIGQSLPKLKALAGQVYMQPSMVLNFTNITLQLPAGQVQAVADWNDVYNIEPWSPPEKLDEVQGQILAGNLTIDTGGRIVPTTPGYLNWLAARGFPTTPESYPIVSIVDDGIDTGDANKVLHPDFYEQGNKSNPDRIMALVNCTRDLSADGLGGHGNINAGIVGGYNDRTGFPYQDENGYSLGLGISPYGRIAGVKNFANTGYFDLSACEDDYQGLVEASFSVSATITSNSWGSRAGGAYTTAAQAYDAATRDASVSTPGNQEMLHVFSAGNSGSSAASIGAPATGKNVLSVGATENVRDEGVEDGCELAMSDSADDVASFSSRGPTRDGRTKPDIMAPGVHIQGPASQAAEFDGTGVCGGSNSRYYPPGQTLYTWSSGTSHSAPAVAGAASLAYEYYRRILNFGQTPSPAMLKALLLNTPRYLTGLMADDTLPSPNQGWGDVNLSALTDGIPRTLIDQTVVLTRTGQAYTQHSTIADSASPLHVSLVWTDMPGTTTGAPYGNDLDLEVVVGTKVYRGNVFRGPISIPDGQADSRNNVENVFIPAGVAENFTVRVVARNIVGDGVPGNADTTDQDFALVVYNDSSGFGSHGNLAGMVYDEATGAPVPGALVRASLSPTRTITMNGKRDGTYNMILPTGSYTLTVSVYPYQPSIPMHVVVKDDEVTSQNIALRPRPSVVLQGTVRDASGAGYPIHARLRIATEGYTYTTTLVTDPVTGRYQVNLAQGIRYTFLVDAIAVPGQPDSYEQETREVKLLSPSATQDFQLAINAEVCTAPGYERPNIYATDFEADNGGFNTNWSASWQWGVSTFGPKAAVSGSHIWGTNLDGNTPGSYNDKLISPRIDLSGYAGQFFLLSWWQWLSYSGYSARLVEVSNDDGHTWKQVDAGINDRQATWTKHSVWLDASYATRNVRVRFTSGYYGHYLDDIGIMNVPVSSVYNQDFEANDGNYSVSGKGSSGKWGVPTSGPNEAHSGRKLWAINLGGMYSTPGQSYLTSPSLDLSGYTGKTFLLSWWQWVDMGYSDTAASVQVSKDNGQTWETIVNRWSSSSWEQSSVWLDASYATSTVRVRFGLRSRASYYPEASYYIDDIQIIQVSVPCKAQVGSLVVGYVLDANTGKPLVGATVTSPQKITTTAEENSSGYYSLFLPPGSHHIGALMDGNYATEMVTVTVEPGTVTRQDFRLNAGKLDAPTLIPRVQFQPDVTGNTSSLTIPIRIANTGAVSASFIVQRLYNGYEAAPTEPGNATADGLVPTLVDEEVEVPGYEANSDQSLGSYAGSQRVTRDSWVYRPSPQALRSNKAVNVLLLTAASAKQIQAILQSYSDIAQVGYIDARKETPELSDLLPYDVVIVLADGAFADPVEVGSVLADYIDAGGSVVQTAPTFYDGDGGGWGLQGRFATEGYSPFIGKGDWMKWAALDEFDVHHPIMRGVRYASDRLRQVVDLHPEATLIAQWQDDEFVAAKGSVVALNTYREIIQRLDIRPSHRTFQRRNC